MTTSGPVEEIASSAEIARGRAAGFYDRKEPETTDPLARMSVEDLQRLIASIATFPLCWFISMRAATYEGDRRRA